MVVMFPTFNKLNKIKVMKLLCGCSLQICVVIGDGVRSREHRSFFFFGDREGGSDQN